MDSAEERRKQNCRWPEANSAGECVERIAAKEELLGHSNQQECDCPSDREAHNCAAGQDDRSEIEGMEKMDQKKERAERDESNYQSGDKLCASPLRDGRPYVPHGRCSSRAATRAGMVAAINNNASPMIDLPGVSTCGL